jgi:hypothetical protein
MLALTDPNDTDDAAWVSRLVDALNDGAARLQADVPAAGPLQRAQLAAIGGLIDIDKEVTKGKAANAVVVAHQGPLREVHYTRLRELNSLADALEGGTGQGSLPPELKQLARQGPGSEANTVSSATPTQPPAGGTDVLDRTFRFFGGHADVWRDLAALHRHAQTGRSGRQGYRLA